LDRETQTHHTSGPQTQGCPVNTEGSGSAMMKMVEANQDIGMHVIEKEY